MQRVNGADGVTSGCVVLPQVERNNATHRQSCSAPLLGGPVGCVLQAELRSAFLEVMDERGDDEIFIEVTLIEGVNDTLEDAEKLVDFLRPFGQRCKVNLIPYNSTGVPGFRASPMRNLLAFQALVRPPQSG